MGFRPLPRGLFFNRDTVDAYEYVHGSFRPLPRGLFFNNQRLFGECRKKYVFVPFLGDFFSIACLRSPSPSALASAFAAGMGKSLHQALSFGDEMPIFPVRTGIGGDGNEKWCCLIPSTHPCFQTSGFRVQGCGGGFAEPILPSPLGEGAPKGRIGNPRHERWLSQMGNASPNIVVLT